MKVNSNYNRDISFKKFYTNKALKKGFEFAADNGALFAASTTLVLSTVARPAAIWMSPKTDKENKKLACAKSISSSGTGFLITLALSLPLSRAIKKMNKSPEIYLKKETINALKDDGNKLINSKGYKFATQLFKLGLGVAVAVPKAIITSAGMPFIMKNFSSEKSDNNQKDLSFKGKENKLAKSIGKILDKKNMQKFSNKYKDTNFPMHIIAGTDILSTLAFIHETNRNKRIKEERKKVLNFNSAISTGLSIMSGYFFDSLLDKPTEKFITKFKKANLGDKNIEKQIEGIKISKPIFLIGGIYYIIIPFVSTFLAENLNKNSNNK